MRCRLGAGSLAVCGVALPLTLTFLLRPAWSQVVCRVEVRAGTQLNVRIAPRRSVVGRVANGMPIRLISSDIDGRPWVRISNAQSGALLGWVYRPFVRCANDGSIKAASDVREREVMGRSVGLQASKIGPSGMPALGNESHAPSDNSSSQPVYTNGLHGGVALIAFLFGGVLTALILLEARTQMGWRRSERPSRWSS
jgi:Bacterial SH3 domain